MSELKFINKNAGEWHLESSFGLIEMEIHVRETGMFQVHIPNPTIRNLYKEGHNGLLYETFSEAQRVGLHIYKDVIKREYETHFTTVMKMGESVT